MYAPRSSGVSVQTFSPQVSFTAPLITVSACAIASVPSAVSTSGSATVIGASIVAGRSA